MQLIKTLITLFSILVGVSSTCIDNTCNICVDKIKILDPSLYMGKISCIDHGIYSKGCDFISEIKPVCTLTPIENTKVGHCYHYHCRWQSKDNFVIKMSVKEPYDTIDIDLYPSYDFSFITKLFMSSIILSIWICMASSSSPFVAGYAGGLYSSRWTSNSGGYGTSSGTC